MNRKRLSMAIAGLLAFLFGFVLALRPAPAEERFDLKVRNDFFAGFSGNREALDRGLKACEQALLTDPKNAEAMVWHGSGIYFLGGQAFQSGDSEKGMDLVQKGVQEMDAAVALAPDSVGVRIPRGAVLLQSTLFISNEAVARPLIEKRLSDYTRTLELQKNTFDELGVHPRGELLFGIADAHRRLGQQDQARAVFQRISTELSGTAYQKRADVWLATGTLTPQQATCAGCHTPGK
jgi:tetratricopeptide (TPR) repeat protein